jgi:hypothetical protein
MRRSIIVNNDHDDHQSISTLRTISTSTLSATDCCLQQEKRSLEDYGFSTNSKRRRHLSPQNINIDMNTDSDVMSSPSAMRKKTRTKSKDQSLHNASLDTSHVDNNQTARVSNRLIL